LYEALRSTSELNESTHQAIGAFIKQYGTPPPALLRIMNDHRSTGKNFLPGVVTFEDLERLFPTSEYEHFGRGVRDLPTTHTFEDGRKWVCEKGQTYGMIRKRRAATSFLDEFRR
jgi:hypothetical protein